MENSSKALIVAGSVILAVLIITLGMYFYNQSTTTGKGINMTEYEIRQFNSKFKMYEGQINTSQALALVEVVERHNLSVGKDGVGVVISNRANAPGAPANYPNEHWPTSTTVWYNNPSDAYKLCLHDSSESSNEILNGIDANNKNKSSIIDKSQFIEGRTYTCYLLYSKDNGLIIGIYIRPNVD